MSMGALAVAARASFQAEWPMDDEFGCSPRDANAMELELTWALYRTVGDEIRLVPALATFV